MKEFEIASRIGKPLGHEDLVAAAAKALGVKPERVGEVEVVRRSVDARGDILYRYRVQAALAGESIEKYELPELRDVHGAGSAIIVGAGPAGLFAALKLISLGIRPVILERGRDVHRRAVDMARISTEGILDPDSNYCYGEGGAGAFSDGKLYTRSSKRGDNREVLCRFVQFGADPDILVDSHPHIGSDRLPGIVAAMRERIVALGGEYRFQTRVTDISRTPDGLLKVSALCGEESVSFISRGVILATGHSARDIYSMLHSKGWAVEAKGFAMGVRVEHPQWLINKIQYHGKWQPGMPVAEYSFVRQVDGRGVFSFCMCPGGVLVPSSTEDGTVVLNGMSSSSRSSRWANAGVVVQVEPGDEPPGYGGPFALMDFQRDVERAMYQWVRSRTAGAHPFAAPAQRMKDFCRGTVSSDLPRTSYQCGVLPAPLHEILPAHVAGRLRKAFPEIDRSMKGYYTNDALLLGVESRTSSAVRIPRNPETLEHVQVPGLYPAGEGAGYAGGIVSSAIDGIRCAEALAHSCLFS